MNKGPKLKEEELDVEPMDISEDETNPEEQAQDEAQVPMYLRKFNHEEYLGQTSAISLRSYKSQAETLMRADMGKHDEAQAEHYFSKPQDKYVWDEELKSSIEAQSALAEDLPIGKVPSITTARSLKEKNWEDVNGRHNWTFKEKLQELLSFKDNSEQRPEEFQKYNSKGEHDYYTEVLQFSGKPKLGRVLGEDNAVQGPQNAAGLTPSLVKNQPLAAETIEFRDAFARGVRLQEAHRKALEEEAVRQSNKTKGFKL